MNVLVSSSKQLLAAVLSFVLIGGILVSFQITMNANGLPNSVTSAKAQSIGYEGDQGSSVDVPSAGGCLGGCSTGGGGGGGGGGSIPSDMMYKFFSCTSVSGGGVCNVGPRMQQDRDMMVEDGCTMILKQGGYTVATGGYGAVSYMKARLVGFWWNPWGPAEAMFSHLTGYDLGWLPYPVGWSDVANAYYNGTGAEFAAGNLSFECEPRYKRLVTYRDTTDTCAPKNDGRPFPYAVGTSVAYKNGNDQRVRGHQNKDWNAISVTCVYINRNTPPPKVLDVVQTCYWNINHVGYYSTSRAAINSGGTVTTNAPHAPADNTRRPYISGNDSNARVNDCTEVIPMDAKLDLQDGYAYYRLQGNAQFQRFQYWIWDTSYTRGQKLLADITPLNTGTTSKVTYGANSCSNNPPFRQYNSFGSLPAQGSIIFDYSDCPQVTDRWECEIPDIPRINNAANAVQLMRDGTNVPFRLPGVRITGDGIRDAATKFVGNVGGQGVSYRLSVVDGSSPLAAGERPASTKKFKYTTLRNADGRTSENFNVWTKDPNGNRTKYLNFYWSSDLGTNWKSTYEARIDANAAEFLVPWQDVADGGVNSRWVLDEDGASCGEKRTSNQATIVRSVSSDG